ncbi:MAG: polyprenyl synthetase family protein [Acidobacteria bacterium]|nr:polyprenyl synthetase family protein [Acidobacteriota bacterium]MCA1643581.1 polyprenyl synthetase family protein [Acidobacteriota bacterium]
MSASSNATDDVARRGAGDAGSDEFPAFVASNRPRIEAALKEWLPVSAAAGTEHFNEALRRAVFPGGKRLRPLLTLISSGLGGASDEQALTLSCAVEFIHTSSLVLDDLPCMDDAEVRRNGPALHVVFGEGVALLAGVALLNQAYALFAASCGGAQAPRLPRLIREAAGCVGSSGMIAGQAAELALSGAHADESAMSSRDLKTTALMRLMMIAGGIVSGAPEREVAALAVFGESLGRAYQIYDDLADALGDQHSTGKSTGQDLRHLRPTALAGLSHAEVRKLAADVLEAGKKALDAFEGRREARLLRSAADHIFAGLRSAHGS